MKTFKEFLLMEEELKEYEGGIDISNQKLKEIPIEYRYGKVKGTFFCLENQLTSLEGAPKEVGGNFWCSHNKLTSLEGSPKKVKGGFFCNNNEITSLKGIPKEVGGNFICYNNPDLFEVSPILSSKIEGKIYYTPKGDDEVSDILNKYKNNPKNLIKMLAELKKIDERFC